MTAKHDSTSRILGLFFLGSAASGLGLRWWGIGCDSSCLVVLGWITMLPALFAAELAFIRFVERFSPFSLPHSLAGAAVLGVACVVIRCCTGCPWLGLAGVLLILPVVLMWLFWPLAALAMSLSQRVASAYHRFIQTCRRH